jgi:hypothetical protein
MRFFDCFFLLVSSCGVRRSSLGCGVVHRVRRNSEGATFSVGSASACCKAGPSSILGSAPQGGSSQ